MEYIVGNHARTFWDEVCKINNNFTTIPNMIDNAEGHQDNNQNIC